MAAGNLQNCWRMIAGIVDVKLLGEKIVTGEQRGSPFEGVGLDGGGAQEWECLVEDLKPACHSMAEAGLLV